MAGTVIDELIVTLGLDPSNYNKGQKDAARSLLKTRQEADKTAKEMEKRGQQAAAFFTKIRNEALATFAVLAIGGGITGFVERSIKSLSDLGYASENLGISAKRLDGWEKAAQRAGGTAQGMAAQLKQSADAVANFHMGMSSPDVDWFFRMGGDASALKNGNTYLLARAKILHDMYLKNPTEAAMLAGKMGISDSEWNFIKQGPGAIQAQVSAQEKLSNATRKNVIAARKLNQEYLDIKNRMQSVSEQLVIEMFPLFKDFCDWLLQGAKWLVKNKTEIKDWADEAVRVIEKFAKEANDAAQSVGGWKTVLEALLALKVLNMANGLFRLAGALTGVGKGLGLIGMSGVGLARLTALLAMLRSGDLNVGEDDDLDASRNARNEVMTGTKAGLQKYMIEEFVANGFSNAVAAGIIGSVKGESGLNPGAVNPTSGASGLFQYLGSRKAAFIKQYGVTPDKATPAQQVSFALQEMHGRYKFVADMLKKARTPGEASDIFTKYFEAPGNKDAHYALRRQYANDTLAWAKQNNALGRAYLPPTTQYWPANYSTTNAVTKHAYMGETHIGKVEIHTLATDADSIAREAGDAFSKYNSFASQANTGLVG